MEIEKLVHTKLEKISKNEILNKLGYASNKKALEAFDKFLDSQDLYSWLHSGFFDFKYTAPSFFKKLCEIIGIEESVVNQSLLDDKIHHAELEKFKDSYIFINTNFKRKSEPIFALAFLESKRHIKINPEKLIFKTDKKILEIVSKLIIDNYKETKGNIGIWGDIVNYVYHNYDDKTYLFDTNGKMIENIAVNESKATLTLKGKQIC